MREGGGAEINHLTSGWSVHLCLGDRLQIGCDIQEHLGGHEERSHSTTRTFAPNAYTLRVGTQTRVLLAGSSGVSAGPRDGDAAMLNRTTGA